MKTKRCKILCILLTLILVAGFLPLGQTAHADTAYPVWVGSTQVTDDTNAIRAQITTTESDKTLSRIAVTTPPNKTSYVAGEVFDPTGMVVTATYSDGTTAPVTGYTWYPDGSLNVIDLVVFVFYEEDTVSRMAIQPITVKANPVNPFVDVAEGKYYYDAVLWALGHDPQITRGTDLIHFSPDDTCTRGQVVTFLWRAAGCPEPSGSKNPFTDVKKGAYYYKAVLWAVEQGITKGTSKTTFSPDEGCTRGQVVTFLHRYEGKPKPASTTNPFTDVKEGAFYYDAVLWAASHDPQITKGTDDTHFSPNDTCTRAQIVTFLYRDMG